MSQSKKNSKPTKPFSLSALPRPKNSAIDDDHEIETLKGEKTTIRKIANSIFSSDDTKRVYCPFHPVTEKKIAGVGITKMGQAFLKCIYCRRTWWTSPVSPFLTPSLARRLLNPWETGFPSNSVDSSDVGEDSDDSEKGTEKTKDAKDSSFSGISLFPPNKRWETPDIPKESGVYLLAGPCGSGKTVQTAKAGKSVNRMLVVAPTIKLSKVAANVYDTEYYQDLEGSLIDDRVSVCLPSIMRVPCEWGTTFDMISLEEIETLGSMIHSQNIMVRGLPYQQVELDDEEGFDDEGQPGGVRTLSIGGKGISGNVYRHLQKLCRHCLLDGGRIVASDAYSNLRSLRLLSRLCGVEQQEITIIGPQENYLPLKGTIETVYNSEIEALAALKTEVMKGMAGTIGLDRRVAVETCAKMIENTDRNDGTRAKVLVIHGRKKDASWADDVTKSWDQYDWVIYNQAAGEGVSYTGTKLSQGWVLASVWGKDCEVTWTSIAQIRNRNRSATDRRSWVMNVVKPLDTNPKRIWDVEKRKASSTDGGRLASKNRPIDGSHFASMVDDLWIKRVKAKSVHHDYYKDLEEKGCKLLEAPTQEKQELTSLRKKFRLIKKDVLNSEVTATMDAASVFSDQYWKLIKKKSKTTEDTRQLDRHDVLEFWGKINQELIVDILRGAGRWQKAYAFVFLVLYSQGKFGYLSQIEKRLSVTPKHVFSGSFQHVELRARIIEKVIEAFGVSFKAISDFIEPTPDVLPPSTTGVVSIDLTAPVPDNHDRIETGCKALMSLRWSTDSIQTMNAADKVRSLDKNYDLRTLIGIGPTKELEDKPVKWFGYILNSVGIKQTRVGKSQKGEYSFDADYLVEWIELCQRLYDKIVKETVPPVELLEVELALNAGSLKEFQDPLAADLDWLTDLVVGNAHNPVEPEVTEKINVYDKEDWIRPEHLDRLDELYPDWDLDDDDEEM